MVLNGDVEMAEEGYISIAQLVENNAELDFHWKPKDLAAVKAQVLAMPALDAKMAAVDWSAVRPAHEGQGWRVPQDIDHGLSLLAKHNLQAAADLWSRHVPEEFGRPYYVDLNWPKYQHGLRTQFEDAAQPEIVSP